MSIRKEYSENLSELKEELLEMCRLTEDMIDCAISALVSFDRTLGKKVTEIDKQVDEYEMDIEKKCMRLLLKQTPVARDFRAVSTALKMITDIERIGDQAADIGDLVATMPGESYIKELEHLPAMGTLAVKMVHDGVDSFIKSDEALADSVIKTDDEMDELFLTVQHELIELIRHNADHADQALSLMMVAKYLERIGDHAVNVAEWTKYNETGVHEKF